MCRGGGGGVGTRACTCWIGPRPTRKGPKQQQTDLMQMLTNIGDKAKVKLEPTDEKPEPSKVGVVKLETDKEKNGQKETEQKGAEQKEADRWEPLPPLGANGGDGAQNNTDDIKPLKGANGGNETRNSTVDTKGEPKEGKTNESGTQQVKRSSSSGAAKVAPLGLQMSLRYRFNCGVYVRCMCRTPNQLGGGCCCECSGGTETIQREKSPIHPHAYRPRHCRTSIDRERPLVRCSAVRIDGRAPPPPKSRGR